MHRVNTCDLRLEKVELKDFIFIDENGQPEKINNDAGEMVNVIPLTFSAHVLVDKHLNTQLVSPCIDLLRSHNKPQGCIINGNRFDNIHEGIRSLFFSYETMFIETELLGAGA